MMMMGYVELIGLVVFYASLWTSHNCFFAANYNVVVMGQSFVV